jgi:hypothetical protein
METIPVEEALRLDSAVVQLIVTKVDASGRPVGELVLQATKVFRARAEDFWPAMDALVAKVLEQQKQQ